jgi:hypothetical protein
MHGMSWALVSAQLPALELRCPVVSLATPCMPRVPRTDLSYGLAPADIDELANPLQAALVSALCFTTGAGLPLLSAAWVPDPNTRIGVLAASTTGTHRWQPEVAV